MYPMRLKQSIMMHPVHAGRALKRGGKTLFLLPQKADLQVNRRLQASLLLELS
jgi:hypothetical protein